MDELDYLIQFTELFSYEHPNDREIVIVGCAFLEELIDKILRSYLVDDESKQSSLLGYSNGALSSFVQKARLLYLLGMINKPVFDDIRIVAKIRNEFAHNVFRDFETDRIGSLCKNLKWHITSMMMEAPEGATNRDLYQVGVNQIITYLNGILSLARVDKRQLRL